MVVVDDHEPAPRAQPAGEARDERARVRGEGEHPAAEDPVEPPVQGAVVPDLLEPPLQELGGRPGLRARSLARDLDPAGGVVDPDEVSVGTDPPGEARQDLARATPGVEDGRSRGRELQEVQPGLGLLAPDGLLASQPLQLGVAGAEDVLEGGLARHGSGLRRRVGSWISGAGACQQPATMCARGSRAPIRGIGDCDENSPPVWPILGDAPSRPCGRDPPVRAPSPLHRTPSRIP